MNSVSQKSALAGEDLKNLKCIHSDTWNNHYFYMGCDGEGNRVHYNA